MKVNISFRNLAAFIVLGFLLLAGMGFAGQDEKAFVGDWHGAVYVGEEEIEIICHFKLDENGKLIGTVDSPSQGATDLTLANITVEGKKISFGVDDPNVGGDPWFAGALDDTGTKISGEFSQGGGVGTFELEKE